MNKLLELIIKVFQAILAFGFMIILGVKDILDKRMEKVGALKFLGEIIISIFMIYFMIMLLGVLL